MRKEILTLISIMASGLAFRLILINGGIDLDESVTEYVSSSNSINELIERIVHYEFGPPLYFFLMMLWRKITPDQAIYLALPSLFFGMLLIPVTYLFAKKLSDSTRVGMLSAFFCAVSPLAMFYSHEARTYSLFAFLNVTSAFFLISWLKEKKKINLVAFALFATLVLYSHYLGLMFIGLLAIGSFIYCWFEKKTALFYKTLPVFLVPAVLFLPWLPYMSEHLKVGTYWTEKTPLNEWWMVILSNLAALIPAPFVAAIFLAIMIIPFFILAILKKDVSLDKGTTFFLIAIITAPVFLLGIITPFIMGYCRYMMPFAPFAWILLAIVVIYLEYKRVWIMSLLAVLTLANSVEAYNLGSKDRSGLRRLAYDIGCDQYKNSYFLMLPDYDTYSLLYYLRTENKIPSTPSQPWYLCSFPNFVMSTPSMHQGYAKTWSDPQSVDRLMSYLEQRKQKTLVVIRDKAVQDSKLMPAKTRVNEVIERISQKYQKIGEPVTYSGRGSSFIVERFNLSSNK